MNQIRVALALCALLFLASCKNDDFRMYSVDTPNLSATLGISHDDWIQIQKLIDEKSQYRLLSVECGPHGSIGAWMAEKAKGQNPSSGPVFFYSKYQGKWYLLDEMSAWEIEGGWNAHSNNESLRAEKKKAR